MNDRSGQQLGNYRLLCLIGRGGFAEVYLGEHVHLLSVAAIKVLSAQLVSQMDVENFRLEAQTIARLTHRHIVRVLDFDVERGVPFLVMEYAALGSLRARHPHGELVPLSLVLAYVQQVADALHFAHEHKLIHRDIKPDNMLLHNEGHVMLSDFGIVTIAHSTSSRSIEGTAGTPSYMAPEQMQGEPRPASDQYALAITIYEWITGRLPFQGTPAEVAMQHMVKPPPSLVEQVPTLPPLVDQVILTALAKDPKQRFATVQAFANALGHAVQSSPSATVLGPAIETDRMVPLSPPSEADSTVPLKPAEQAFQPDSTQKPGALMRTPKEREAVRMEPAVQTLPPAGRAGAIHTSDQSRQQEAETPSSVSVSAITQPSLPALGRPATPEHERRIPRRRKVLLVVLLLLLLIGSTLILTSFFSSQRQSSINSAKSGQSVTATTVDHNKVTATAATLKNTTATVQTSTSTALSRQDATAIANATQFFGQNLIVNGNAEMNTGAANSTTVVPPSGWTSTLGFTVLQYGTPNFPQSTDPGPADRGSNFFAGGPSAVNGQSVNNARTTASQDIDVSSVAVLLDAGTVSYTLSGYLGGYTLPGPRVQGTQEDNAACLLEFLSTTNTVLGQYQIGPVTAADRGYRTGLLERQVSGTVPAGTRHIRVTLIMTKQGGGVSNDYNDGYADDVSLILQS
jgi:serine/threonine protein kinase